VRFLALRIAAPVLAALVASAAEAQSAAPGDPVVTHFREYRAALERNDLPAAEAAAAAALTASEAASGQRTGVLALKLANLRLELGSPHDALTPARTAHGLATASAASGVDATAAALTLGRAELAAGDDAGGARLRDAIAAASSNTALETDVYNAAVALGAWALAARDYSAARNAWATAARLAHTTADTALAQARALTSEGAAIFLAGIDNPAAAGGAVFSVQDAQAANDAFTTAQRLVTAAAMSAAPQGELTPAHSAYAEALGWQSALLAKLQSSNATLPTATPFRNDREASEANAWCRVRTVRSAQIDYPVQALERYGVGAVVLHMGLDAGGDITSRKVAVAIPPGVLAAAVEQAAGEWRIERDASSPRDCRMPSSAYVNVRFVLQ
jgi:hypothetical protein